MYSTLYRKQKEDEQKSKNPKAAKRAKSSKMVVDPEPSDEPPDDEEIIQQEIDIIDFDLMEEQCDLEDMEAKLGQSIQPDNRGHPFPVIFLHNNMKSVIEHNQIEYNFRLVKAIFAIWAREYLSMEKTTLLT